MFKSNESNLDRSIRLVVGVVILLLAIFSLSGTTQIVAFLIAGLAIFTGLSGFCALYKLFGISTKK